MLDRTVTEEVYLDTRLIIGGNGYKSSSRATTSGGSTPSSQLSARDYIQHLRELAEGKPELEAGLRHVEGLIAKDRGSGYWGRRGSLIYQSIDGD
jgi:hypothetical protein